MKVILNAVSSESQLSTLDTKPPQWSGAAFVPSLVIKTALSKRETVRERSEETAEYTKGNKAAATPPDATILDKEGNQWSRVISRCRRENTTFLSSQLARIKHWWKPTRLVRLVRRHRANRRRQCKSGRGEKSARKLTTLSTSKSAALSTSNLITLSPKTTNLQTPRRPNTKYQRMMKKQGGVSSMNNDGRRSERKIAAVTANNNQGHAKAFFIAAKLKFFKGVKKMSGRMVITLTGGIKLLLRFINGLLGFLLIFTGLWFWVLTYGMYKAVITYDFRLRFSAWADFEMVVCIVAAVVSAGILCSPLTLTHRERCHAFWVQTILML